MNNFELIIFDCDGVLVDSERIANEIFASVIAEECGLTFSLDDMYRTFVGHSSGECMKILASLLGNEPPPDLEEKYETRINTALALSVKPVEGVQEVLANLTLPCCVASSGSHEKMQTTLGKTGLLSLFENKRFSVSEVARGKPHPDIFLYAAEKMGVNDVKRCLVIEDSTAGVKAGVAAGMTVFGFAAMTDRETLLQAGAHHVFNNMQNLIADILNYR
jgi:HAD superfamily hydrolase (TIGR01509 family)